MNRLLEQHQRLRDIWSTVQPDRKCEAYWHQVVKASAAVRQYLLDLCSSQSFNDIELKGLSTDGIGVCQPGPLQLQSVDVRRVVGHTGHNKLSDSIYTWRNVLVSKLKDETICHLMNYIIDEQMYSKSYNERLVFYKANSEFYFGSQDGLHRIIMAKYILSNNVDTFLHGVQIIDCDNQEDTLNRISYF